MGTSGERMPKVIVFDLDYTLWDLWIDTHIYPPLRRQGKAINALTDRHNTPLAFYHEVPKILSELRASNVHVAVASRTSAPDLAREALNLLLLSPDKQGDDPEKAWSYFQTFEIYPGSKLRHFRSIQKKTGIPYEEMLFFDDESRNKEVEQLGVTMQLVPHGVDRAIYNKGLAEWRRRRAADGK